MDFLHKYWSCWTEVSDDPTNCTGFVFCFFEVDVVVFVKETCQCDFKFVACSVSCWVGYRLLQERQLSVLMRSVSLLAWTVWIWVFSSLAIKPHWMCRYFYFVDSFLWVVSWTVLNSLVRTVLILWVISSRSRLTLHAWAFVWICE